jgi:TP901-1 family phage major tail protein
MAIKNASDLLVYRKYPSGQKQVTRIKVKSSAPLNTNGSVYLNDIVDSSGSPISQLETSSTSSNTGAGVLAVIYAKLVTANSYTASAVSTIGEYSYQDFTNPVVGESATLYITDAGAEILEDAIIVTIETEGEGSSDKTPVAFSTSASLSINRDMRDITTKDSDGFQQSAAGLMSFEISTDALQDFTSDLDFKDFFDNILNREAVTIQFSERTTSGSDKYYEGSAYVTSLSMDAGVEDNVTYSVTFTGTGLITSGTD